MQSDVIALCYQGVGQEEEVRGGVSPAGARAGGRGGLVAEVMGRVRFGSLPGGKWWRRGFGVSPLLVLQGVGG